MKIALFVRLLWKQMPYYYGGSRYREEQDFFPSSRFFLKTGRKTKKIYIKVVSITSSLYNNRHTPRNTCTLFQALEKEHNRMKNLSSKQKSESPEKEVSITKTPKDPRFVAAIFEAARNRTKTSLEIRPATPIRVVKYDQIELGKLLGTGSFSCGIDIKSIDHQRCENLVLKTLRREVLTNVLVFAACAADLRQEGRILACLSHPNITRIEGWGGEEMIANYLGGNKDSSYLILEKLVETLDQRILKWNKHNPSFWTRFKKGRREDYAKLQEEKCLHMMSLARAIDHFHSHNILHRDLKPNNIGFASDGVLKVFDFDLARLLPSGQPDKLFKLTANVGSPRYMAPEVQRGDRYNLEADCFSFAVLVYEMLTSKTPYGGMERDWGESNKTIPASWSEEFRAALKSCLSSVITKRPDAKTIRVMLEQELGLYSSEVAESRDDDDDYATEITKDFALGPSLHEHDIYFI